MQMFGEYIYSQGAIRELYELSLDYLMSEGIISFPPSRPFSGHQGALDICCKPL